MYIHVCMCCHSYGIRGSTIHTGPLGWIGQLHSCWNTSPEVTVHLTLYPLTTYVLPTTLRKPLEVVIVTKNWVVVSHYFDAGNSTKLSLQVQNNFTQVTCASNTNRISTIVIWLCLCEISVLSCGIVWIHLASKTYTYSTCKAKYVSCHKTLLLHYNNV